MKNIKSVLSDIEAGDLISVALFLAIMFVGDILLRTSLGL